MVLKKMLLFVAMIMLLVIGSQGFSQSALIESFDYPATIDGLGAAGAGWGGSWAIDTSAGGTENCAVMAGYVFDVSGSYQLAFLTCAGTSIIGMMLAAVLRPRKR